MKKFSDCMKLGIFTLIFSLSSFTHHTSLYPAATSEQGALVGPVQSKEFDLEPMQEGPEGPTAEKTGGTKEIDEENISDEAKQKIMGQLQKMHLQLTEQLSKLLIDMLDKYVFSIEHLAQVLNNGQIPKAAVKEALPHLKNLRKIVIEIKKTASTVTDLHNLKVLLAINHALIKHLKALVKNGLRNIPPLDLESVIKRSMHEKLDPEKIEDQIKASQKALDKLDKEVQVVGLSLFNRLYRRFEKFNSDHNVLMNVGAITLSSFFAIYLVSTSVDSILNNYPNLKKDYPKLYALLKDGIGQSLYQLQSGDLGNASQFEAKNSRGWFASALGWFQQFGGLNTAMPPIATWVVLAKPFKNTWENLKLWTAKKWERLRTWLRGGPLQNKVESWRKDPKATFDEVIGKEHIKQAFQVLIDYIMEPDRFDRAGMRPSPGYLLYGPPGSGKTYLVEALAGEIKRAMVARGLGDKFNFLSFDASDVMQWGLEAIIYHAKLNAPCVVFIDEIQLCGWQNERNGANLANALTSLSGCMNISQDTSKTVIIIGATNNPENIDKALRRRGRFGVHLYSDYPTYIDRLNFLKRELENRAMEIDEKYLEALAQETERCTFEDLKAILITAMQKAKGRRQIVAKEHLEESVDEVVRHIVSDELKLSEDKKQLLATHQAGHVLASLLCNKTPRISKVTIRPINLEISEEHVMAKYYNGKERKRPKQHVEYGKVFELDPHDEVNTIKTRETILNEIRVLLAGFIAEKILLGGSSYTYHGHERGLAFDAAKHLVFEGMYEEDLTKEKRNKLIKQAYSLMMACEFEITQLLTTHKEVLVAIATALQKNLTLSSVELLEILKAKDQEKEAADARKSDEEKIDEAPPVAA